MPEADWPNRQTSAPASELQTECPGYLHIRWQRASLILWVALLLSFCQSSCSHNSDRFFTFSALGASSLMALLTSSKSKGCKDCKTWVREGSWAGSTCSLKFSREWSLGSGKSSWCEGLLPWLCWTPAAHLAVGRGETSLTTF